LSLRSKVQASKTFAFDKINEISSNFAAKKPRPISNRVLDLKGLNAQEKLIQMESCDFILRQYGAQLLT
jgi:hypothetical protein